jgi:hypothetical protein
LSTQQPDSPAADRTSVSELAFVVGPDQPRRLVELAEALAAEVRELRIAARIERRALPERRPGRVPVVLHPAGLRFGGRVATLARRALDGSVVVHAGVDPFAPNARASTARAAFELDLESVGRRQTRGESVTHLPVGWSRRWEAAGEQSRDIDLAIVGSATDREFRWLARSAADLARWRVHVDLVSDARGRSDGDEATAASARLAALGRSKVVIDLSPAAGPRLDSVRAAEAICAGAVLVRTAARPLDPLRVGRDYVEAGDDPFGAIAALLSDPGGRELLRSSASATLAGVPLRSAAESLIAAAEAVPPAGPRRALSLARAAAGDEAPPPVTTDPDAAAARRRLKRVRLEEIKLARELDRLGLQLDGEPDDPRVELESPALEGTDPRVSVMVTLFNYEDEITGALDSVAASEFGPLELVIVDDSSKDASRARARSWMEAHPEVAARLIVHPANRGLPSARNTAFAHARGDLLFILDADNRVLPHALGRLAEALDSDPGAAFAYGLAARVDEGGRPVGLLNLAGWDPPRLRHLNYIDAMAMIRREALRRFGGYTTELTLYGWEDYDLWCRMAEAGMRGAYLPEILAIYRSSESSMARSVCDISTTDAYRKLIERVPKLMAGVRPPR